MLLIGSCLCCDRFEPAALAWPIKRVRGCYADARTIPYALEIDWPVEVADGVSGLVAAVSRPLGGCASSERGTARAGLCELPRGQRRPFGGNLAHARPAFGNIAFRAACFSASVSPQPAAIGFGEPAHASADKIMVGGIRQRRRDCQ